MYFTSQFPGACIAIKTNEAKLVKLTLRNLNVNLGNKVIIIEFL